MCFVTWSARIAAAATVPSPAHCHAPAPSGRSATDTGARPSVDEPTRTSFIHVPGVRSRAGLPLVVDAEARPRDGPQALGRDRLAAHLARPVRAVVDLPERVVDVAERLLHAFLEPLVELA